MTQEEMKQTAQEAVDNEQPQFKKRHNLEPFRDSTKTRRLRMWLNIIFMIGAVAGLIVYYKADHETAKYILIVACVFKFVELALRILKI
ncbi:MAG: hypothetical protein IJQ76_00630 [Prevotella sp.]|jgi:phage shock protein PspC (stress-responsive transcriptional regulator)|nr:hypothetical protein [Prevotella sp.]